MDSKGKIPRYVGRGGFFGFIIFSLVGMSFLNIWAFIFGGLVGIVVGGLVGYSSWREEYVKGNNMENLFKEILEGK